MTSPAKRMLRSDADGLFYQRSAFRQLKPPVCELQKDRAWREMNERGSAALRDAILDYLRKHQKAALRGWKTRLAG